MNIPLEEIVCSCTEEEPLIYNDARPGNYNNNIFKDLFEKECTFSLPKHDVLRIQHAVEIMVLYLLTSIYELTSFNDLVCCNKKVTKTMSSAKSPHRIHESFKEKNLLKVGSYYEKTKNCYPDEFDYICIIAECDATDYICMKDATFIISDLFHQSLRECIESGLKFPVGNCLQFDKYVRLHGPAAMLKFNYRSLNESSPPRNIFVDLSPACKVYVRNNLPKEINPPYPDWKDFIIETGSFLILKFYNCGHPKNETKIKISITESEQNFLQEKMSEKHKRIYRLLKYIFKGNMSDEDLRQHVKNEENEPDIVGCQLFHPKIVYDLSSYIIKTLMFHHCYHCKRDAETSDEGCIVAALNHLLTLCKKEQNIYSCLSRPFLKHFECDEQITFSVSLPTMIGEDIEIADRYRASIKIVKALDKFVHTITDDTSTSLVPSNRTVTDQIPIAKELQKVIQRDTEILSRGKKCTNCRLQSFFTLSFAIIYAFGAYLHFELSQLHKETEYCFPGPVYMEGIIFAQLGNLSFTLTSSSLAPGKDTFQNTSIQFMCMDQRRSSEEAYKNSLYYCESKGGCTADRQYLLKTDMDESDQRTVCDAYTIHSVTDSQMNASENNSVFEHIERRVMCVLHNTSCLSVDTMEYLAAMLGSKTSACHDEGNFCLWSLLEDKNVTGCNYVSSKLHRQGDISARKEICCDGIPCTKPQPDQSLGLTILGAMAFLLSFLLCCGCASIKECIKYKALKKKIGRQDIP